MQTFMLITVDATGFSADEIAFLEQLYTSAGGSVEVITKGDSEHGNDGRAESGVQGEDEGGEGGEEGAGYKPENANWREGYERGFCDGYDQRTDEYIRAKSRDRIART